MSYPLPGFMDKQPGNTYEKIVAILIQPWTFNQIQPKSVISHEIQDRVLYYSLFQDWGQMRWRIRAPRGSIGTDPRLKPRWSARRTVPCTHTEFCILNTVPCAAISAGAKRTLHAVHNYYSTVWVVCIARADKYIKLWVTIISYHGKQ